MPPSHNSTARRVGLVMTYNQRETCIEAINSLFAQTLALDLIIVSDDCSTDGTYELIADYFSKNGKPSNVELYQSEKNLGFIPHFNVLLKNHCRDDDLIFYNAGDDISEIIRVEEFYREYAAKGKPQHFLGHSYVTSFGSGTEEILAPPIESIKENRELCLIASAYHIGASQVFTGALFFDFGPILFDDCYEDLTLGYRALLKNAYHFIPKALLRYRIGGLSSWQKNPLEKKRGRLKSTLTQRAVDSMRSGDFEALKIIQDCYSQYGFSHTPHPNRVRIIIVSDEAPDSRLYTYSISDHFSRISNVSETELKTPSGFLNLSDGNSTSDDPLNLVWLVASRMSSAHLGKLVARAKSDKGTRFVLDLGLIPTLKTIFPNLNTADIVKELINSSANVFIHTANVHLYRELMKYPELLGTTYLPPLQDIDGPDPTIPDHEEKRGIVVTIGENAQQKESLSVLENVFIANRRGLGGLHTLQLTQFTIDGEILCHARYDMNTAFATKEIDFNNYDYLIVIGGSSPEESALVHYWWELGAKHCLPTFIDSAMFSPNQLTHGSNCLFVNNNINSWAAAIDLLLTRYDALQAIAKKARRDLYFEFSIQKRVRHVSEIIGNYLSMPRFFDKYLPL